VCAYEISLKDALCPGCGRFVIGDLSNLEQVRRMRTRGPGGMIACAVVGGVLSVLAVVAIESRDCERTIRRSQAKNDVSAILPVADKWVADHPGQCPTMKRLRDDKELSAGSKLTDPWDRTYRIECQESIAVISDGPDRRAGTADDIHGTGPTE